MVVSDVSDRYQRNIVKTWKQTCHACFESAKDAKEFFLAKIRIEWTLLTLFWPSILFGIFFQWVHKVGTNVAYFLHQPREVLPDLGFSVIPPLTKKQQIFSEYLFFSFVTFIAVFAISTLFINYERPKYLVLMAWRFVTVLSLAQCLRVVTFLSTSLPGPNYHCRPGSTEYHPPTTIGEMLSRSDPFHGCGDLVFSSHTIFVLLFVLLYRKYGEGNIIKNFLVVLAVVFGCFVISARKHYTVDIVVAMYTVPLLWQVHCHYFPDFIPGGGVHVKRRPSVTETDIEKQPFIQSNASENVMNELVPAQPSYMLV